MSRASRTTTTTDGAASDDGTAGRRLLRCPGSAGLARFWAEALRWEVDDETDDEIGLVPTDGTTFRIVFRPVPDRKEGRNRIHFDLTTTSLDDQHGSVSRLVERGARPIDVGQGPDEPHVVLADPEGNEFCLIEPENSFLAGCGRLGALSCDGSQAVGHFWSKALGWPLVWDQDEETAIRAPDGTLGATPVDIGQGPVGWVVMSDPDGNEFWVLNPG